MMRKLHVFWAIFLYLVIIALILLLARLFVPSVSFAVYAPKTAPETILAGKNWTYAVPFPVENKTTIQKLIQCESHGVNISRKDSNGKISWGILQFNGTSTWQEAEARFDFYGSPLNPADAIHMADMMISAGELGKWTCARMLNL